MVKTTALKRFKKSLNNSSKICFDYFILIYKVRILILLSIQVFHHLK